MKSIFQCINNYEIKVIFTRGHDNKNMNIFDCEYKYQLHSILNVQKLI